MATFFGVEWSELDRSETEKTRGQCVCVCMPSYTVCLFVCSLTLPLVPPSILLLVRPSIDGWGRQAGNVRAHFLVDRLSEDGRQLEVKCRHFCRDALHSDTLSLAVVA